MIRIFTLLLINLLYVFVTAAPGCAQEDKPTVTDQLFLKAAEFVDNGQYRKAAESLAKILKSDKENAEAWQMLGYALQANGELDRAIVIHKKAAKFPRAKIPALYNLACSYALKNKKDEALRYLGLCIDAGFADEKLMLSDADLASLRKHKTFGELRARISSSKQTKIVKKIADLAPIFTGDWNVVDGFLAGRRISQKALPIAAEISETSMRMPIGQEEVLIEYTVNRDQKPYQVEMNFLKGKPEAPKCFGILDINGDTATLCYHPNGTDRPLEFSSDSDNGQIVFEFQKRNATINRKSLYGTWQFINGNKKGTAIEKERFVQTVTITKDQIMIPGNDGNDLLVTYAVDSSKTPAAIDMAMYETETGNLVSPGLGIIQANGKSVLICYDPKGLTRPKRFSTTRKDGFHMFTLKRMTSSKTKKGK